MCLILDILKEFICKRKQCFLISFLISSEEPGLYFASVVSLLLQILHIFFFSNISYYIFSMFEISLQEETWQYLAYIFSILTVCSRTQCSLYIKQIHIRYTYSKHNFQIELKIIRRRKKQIPSLHTCYLGDKIFVAFVSQGCIKKMFI